MTSVRRILWNAGAPTRLVLLAAIRTYQLTLIQSVTITVS